MDYEKHTVKHIGNVSLSEKKSSCLFKNPNKIDVYKVKVDGGLISDYRERCDYLVHWEKEQNSFVFFVELKGGDVDKACRQLERTIDYTKEKFGDFENKHCIIVCSKYPSVDSTVQRYKQIMKKKGFDVQIKTNKFEYTIL